MINKKKERRIRKILLRDASPSTEERPPHKGKHEQQDGSLKQARGAAAAV